MAVGPNDEVIRLRAELERVRAELERRVAERTAELAAAMRQLELLARTDRLTGLHSRHAIDEQLARLVARHGRHGGTFSAVILDVDGFKVVNEVHGHHGGDWALCEIGRRLATRARREDVIGRWGGDEFVVLAADTSAEGAAILAEGLREAIGGDPFDALDELTLTTSIGWATWDREEEGDDLLQRADAALYVAKATGANSVRAAA